MVVKAFDAMSATITVTDNGDGNFTAAIQVKGETGVDSLVSRAVMFYLSTQSDGSDLATNSTDVTSLAIATDGLAIELSTNVAGVLVSESDGDIDLTIVVPTTKTVYLVLVLPNGKLEISDAMAYNAS